MSIQIFLGLSTRLLEQRNKDMVDKDMLQSHYICMLVRLANILDFSQTKAFTLNFKKMNHYFSPNEISLNIMPSFDS